MKRIISTVLIATCVVFLQGASDNSILSGPTSFSPTNLAQPSNDGTNTRVVAQGVKPTLPTARVPPLQLFTAYLPGEFAIRLQHHISFGFLTAVGGGGETADAFHTDLKDASKIGTWEKFRLVVEPGHHRAYAIVTKSGNFVTAVDGGGRAVAPVLQTNRTEVQAWEKFNLFQDWIYYYIRVSDGHIVRLVDGVIRTDGDVADPSLAFLFYKCGDPGPDSLFSPATALGYAFIV